MTGSSTSERKQTFRGMAYSEKGTLHLIPWNAEVWSGERQPAVCGGGFPADKPLHTVNGLMLSDELQKGHLCDECLSRILGENVTIPGFVVDGELVGEAARYHDTANDHDVGGA